MSTRLSTHPEFVKSLDTQGLREHFLIEDLFQEGKLQFVHTMHDRMVVMGIVPKGKSIELPALNEITKADYFLERRELGIINVGKTGLVTVDGKEYSLENKECLYIGKGAKNVSFTSKDGQQPAEFYVNSCPAHKSYPTKKAALSDANEVNLGSKDNCNERTIYQYIHEDGIESCQLVMGFTTLQPGSIWNTFPPHTHLRRMEVYMYFDLDDDQIVMHFMGEPKETRHLAIHNKQAIISPEWSIHSGAGTSSYSFVWGMAGENKAFTDMDGEILTEVR